jgi:hypothetical protein
MKNLKNKFITARHPESSKPGSGKDGQGFGLHSGVLAAKEMGGALVVHSAGPGHGATFTLERPAQTNSNSLCQPK